MREWKMRYGKNAGVEYAAVENSGVDGRGGNAGVGNAGVNQRDGKCRKERYRTPT